MLAAWTRIKYPHLIHAAVASSAPLKAQLDFQGYARSAAEDRTRLCETRA